MTEPAFYVLLFLGALHRAPNWGRDVIAFLRDWRAYRNGD
jgi:hypothetical protein